MHEYASACGIGNRRMTRVGFFTGSLLDTSFLIDLERETAKGQLGPARHFLPSLRERALVVSIVTARSFWRARPMRPPR